MFIKSFAVLGLATGFAAAKPINSLQSLPAYPKRQISGLGDLGGGQDGGFSFIDGFNNFEKQSQVVQVQKENLKIVNVDGKQQVEASKENVQIVDDGKNQAVKAEKESVQAIDDGKNQAVKAEKQSVQVINQDGQQKIVQQAQQVLVVDQKGNGFNKNLNDLFRTTNARKNKGDKTTVMMVVTQINIAIDDGKGNQIQQQVFAQSILVANRGKKETEQVMIFDSRTLIAQDILGGKGGGGEGGVAGVAGVGTAGVAGATEAAALPTKSADVQLLGAKPTWSSVVEDPAASNGAIWQEELQALQQNGDDAADAQLNAELAAQQGADAAAGAEGE